MLARKNRLVCAAVVVCCVAVTAQGAAAAIVRLPSSKGLPPSRGPNGTWLVAIVNTMDVKVRFVIREPGSPWQPQAQEAGEKAVYQCTQCRGRFDIGISTGGVPVVQSVRSGALYGIRFDSRRRAYGIIEIE